METPLSPLDFARRARRLYADRDAVIDGGRRFTYREFFSRCDRWSSALQKLGVKPGDRVATIAPNTHAHLEAFYAVPQIGAVIVPINFRLTAADFAAYKPLTDQDILGIAILRQGQLTLLMGQADEGSPVIHARGVPYARRNGSAKELLRSKKTDLFR